MQIRNEQNLVWCFSKNNSVVLTVLTVLLNEGCENKTKQVYMTSKSAGESLHKNKDTLIPNSLSLNWFDYPCLL